MMKQKDLFSDHAAAVLSDWIEKEFGTQADEIRKATVRKYREFVRSAPDYGGRKSPHVNQIYDSFLLLAFCTISPKNYTLEELEPLSFEMLMSPFRILGKLFRNQQRNAMLMRNSIRMTSKLKFSRMTKKTESFAIVSRNVRLLILSERIISENGCR